MADVVNLRIARKRATRQQEELRASANRLAHGRPAAERKLDAAQAEKDSHNLDRHRIDRGDGR
ncbi:MAG TPA: DUF4169 family protein [Pseudolabrys sp.]|jgi:hypothetical protein|nr:DUF4169 family protein [Pseudolabrys sp.]